MIGILFSLSMLVYSLLMMAINLSSGEKPISAVDNSVYIASIIINLLLLVFFCYNMTPYLIYNIVKVDLREN